MESAISFRKLILMLKMLFQILHKKNKETRIHFSLQAFLMKWVMTSTDFSVLITMVTVY